LVLSLAARTGVASGDPAVDHRVNVDLKWPNDLLLTARSLRILTEMKRGS